MNNLQQVLEQLKDQELHHVIEILVGVVRYTAAGIFIMTFAFLYVVYSRSRQLPYSFNASGIIFIMLGVLVWVFMASSKILFNANNNDIFFGLFFSTFNNGFLIATLPYFGNGFSIINKVKLFNNRLVWVITSLILCMAVSLLLFLIGIISPGVSEVIEIGFSMLSMSLFGYAAFTSFLGRRSNILTLFILALPPVTYAVLQIILSFHSDNHDAQFWFYRSLFIIISNSMMGGMILLTCVNLLLVNLEDAIHSEKANIKNLEADLQELQSNAELMLAENQRLHELIKAKDKIIQDVKLEAGQLPQSVYLKSILIGFDNKSIEKYFISFTFMFGDEPLIVKCSNSKLTVPHSHWIIFALARKKGITLKHPDIAQTKFQMIKYLNSFALNYKIQQEYVFRNNGGEFDIHVHQDDIHFEEAEGLSGNVQLLETFKKYAISFGVNQNSKSSTEDVFKSLATLFKSH